MSDSCDPMDCSPPGSSAHGILQAKILEWVASSFSRDMRLALVFLYFLLSSQLYWGIINI